ncbi:hypothetical protein E4U43_008735 [Claviceps pusilla]|uniref:Uncharacterized protein n=1 Tax=Claviceps pusilla TaxID=123648 RepID=A0A9P7T0J6_9HYPO|nr:hypothetical protein E4U43_008735 [Claviceps pusilla]
MSTSTSPLKHNFTYASIDAGRRPCYTHRTLHGGQARRKAWHSTSRNLGNGGFGVHYAGQQDQQTNQTMSQTAFHVQSRFGGWAACAWPVDSPHPKLKLVCSMYLRLACLSKQVVASSMIAQATSSIPAADAPLARECVRIHNSPDKILHSASKWRLFN